MYIYNIYIFIIFIANNTIHPVIIENNDEARLVNNTVLYQEESVKPLHNFNKKSEFVSSTFCIPCYKIEEEPDHIDKPVTVNSSTLELVCIAPQLNNAILVYKLKRENLTKTLMTASLTLKLMKTDVIMFFVFQGYYVIDSCFIYLVIKIVYCQGFFK